MSEKESQNFKLGQKLEAYLSQPFYIAEPYTDRPGCTVAIDYLFHDVQQILADQVSDLGRDSLLYQGDLSSVGK